MSLANMLSPPPYARRVCCSAWAPRPVEPCAHPIHRFDHAERTCRCGAQVVPLPQARDQRGRHRRGNRQGLDFHNFPD